MFEGYYKGALRAAEESYGPLEGFALVPEDPPAIEMLGTFTAMVKRDYPSYDSLLEAIYMEELCG